MRCVTCARALCVVAASACLLAGGAALLAEDSAATRPAFPASAPELKRGEIVIKRTGRTKRVAVQAAAPARPAARLPAELPYDGPGPRVVTIGYLVRDPSETGWGPRVHCPAPPYGFGYGGSCDPYGYDAHGPLLGVGAPLLFDSPSFFPPPAPVTRGFRCR